MKRVIIQNSRNPNGERSSKTGAVDLEQVTYASILAERKVLSGKRQTKQTQRYSMNKRGGYLAIQTLLISNKSLVASMLTKKKYPRVVMGQSKQRDMETA